METQFAESNPASQANRKKQKRTRKKQLVSSYPRRPSPNPRMGSSSCQRRTLSQRPVPRSRPRRADEAVRVIRLRNPKQPADPPTWRLGAMIRSPRAAGSLNTPAGRRAASSPVGAAWSWGGGGGGRLMRGWHGNGRLTRCNSSAALLPLLVRNTRTGARCGAALALLRVSCERMREGRGISRGAFTEKARSVSSFSDH